MATGGTYFRTLAINCLFHLYSRNLTTDVMLQERFPISKTERNIQTKYETAETVRHSIDLSSSGGICKFMRYTRRFCFIFSFKR